MFNVLVLNNGPQEWTTEKYCYKNIVFNFNGIFLVCKKKVILCLEVKQNVVHKDSINKV